MIIPGYRYHLLVDRIEAKGAWLSDQKAEVFLPKRECPEELSPATELEVFVYLDRNGLATATTQMPAAAVGEFATMRVQSVGDHGAFLDWGLAKDLLAPFSEQSKKMLEGRRYLVRVCHDSQQRPIATSRFDRFLSRENRDLEEGQGVELIVWAFTDLGAKVIVNDSYEALLYQNDIPPGLKCGDRLSGYVSRIRADQRIDISLSRPGKSGVDDARETLLELLQTHGFLPLTDQSSPELIRERLGMSKKQFKKAIGGLYKDGLITLEEEGLRLIS
jgi:predicted RNA-binding protein (virulence factor B family)